MRILLRMPNWLGDAVMATPAVDHLMRHHRNARLVLVGSPAVASMFETDPAFTAVVADCSKSQRHRTLALWQFARRLRDEHGPFDAGVAFPNSLSSRLLLRFAGVKQRVGAKGGLAGLLLTHRSDVDRRAHQAEIYHQIVGGYLGANTSAGPARLHVDRPHRYPNRTIGINPGAAYGSAKRWLPERFAEVARRFSGAFDIVLFGSPQEAPMAAEIEVALRRAGVKNCRNTAGKTSLPELLAMIAGLDLFITNDSGPMHIAGALGIPLVAIFGSTNHLQTCPWQAEHIAIVRRDLACAPCMKRTCPLGHHACMNDIGPDEVHAAAVALLEQASRWHEAREVPDSPADEAAA